MKILARWKRPLAFFFLTLMLFQVFPVAGNSRQQVVLHKEQGEVTEWVDLFTGDFNFSIPLFELPASSGNYPISLNYRSGNYKDTQSSWVGLGWQLSVQNIHRKVNGLPDEFAGDEIQALHDIAPGITIGAGAGVGQEVFGKTRKEQSGDVRINSFNVFQNNYTGLGYAINNNAGYHTALGSEGTRLFNNNPFYDGSHALSSELQTQIKHPALRAPLLPVAIQNKTTTFTQKTGNAWAGHFSHGFITGYYNVQKLVHEGKWMSYPAFGAFHPEQPEQENAVVDVFRNAHSPVTRTSDLPASRLQQDEFILHDAALDQNLVGSNLRPCLLPQSVRHITTISKGIGKDNAIFSHQGHNNSILNAQSYAGTWKDETGVSESLRTFTLSGRDRSLDLQNSKYGVRYNNVTSFSTDPFRLKLSGSGKDVKISDLLNIDDAKLTERIASVEGKGSVVQILTNHDVLNAGGNELLPHLRITYSDVNGSEMKFNRAAYPKHHIASITTIESDGKRYNYGLPSYVLTHEEVVFSGTSEGNGGLVKVGNGNNELPAYQHKDIDKYLSYVKTPAYAESFLLTSIVGTDYIDIHNDGVTSDDAGYWVKFKYKKTTTDTRPFRQRNPFVMAHLAEGNVSKRDDKGLYTYAEKELWYVQEIETSTHVARFITEDRMDAYGAAGRLQDQPAFGVQQQALTEIRLFSKNDLENPVKVVKLQYDYSLFSGEVSDNISGKGKLTLKKLWFENYNNTRGSQNPYLFEYGLNSRPGSKTDRWGVQSLSSSDPLQPSYVDQTADRTLRDQAVAIGNLKSLITPAGKKIEVLYESDDYGYVQHHIAQQMMPLAGDASINDQDMKVLFRLESAIPGNASGKERQELISTYLPENGKIDFRIRINLQSKGENKFDWVTGSASIDRTKSPGLEKDASGNYTHGYFYLIPEEGRHPFSLQAWQQLRDKVPFVMEVPGEPEFTTDEQRQWNQVERLVATAAQVRKIHENYFDHCNAKGWGREIDLAHSYVRLNSPDKVKLGGDARVRQITIEDQWSEDERDVYGYWLDYSREENGKIISSGVAQNEPSTGSEENVLLANFPQLADFYPSASVGYSQVHAYTLASASLAGKSLQGNLPFHRGEGVTFGTKGAIVYEFYTAREFPTIVQATNRDNESYAVDAIDIVVNQLVASQGYSVVNNDMHGKLKSIAWLRQLPSGAFVTAPVAYEQHEYFSESLIYDDKKVFALVNRFAEEGDGSLAPTGNPTWALGQREEAYIDLSEISDISFFTGTEENVDDLSMSLFEASELPITVNGVASDVSFVSTTLKTAVLGRFITQHAVKKSATFYRDGAVEQHQYLKFDKTSGVPVFLSKSGGTKKETFEKIIPAYTKYKSMGPASLNLDKELAIADLKKRKDGIYTFSAKAATLHAGDELVLFTEDAERSSIALTRAVYLGVVNGVHQLGSDLELDGKGYHAKIVRSGYRNQVEAPAGKIVTAAGELTGDVSKQASRSFIVPK